MTRPVFAVVVLSLLQAANAAAQSSNVEFTVSGSSTVRNWTCTAQGVIVVTPGTSATPLPGVTTGVQSATVTVPLKAFKCPNDEMTGHLNDAMKSGEFPEIVYRLERYEVAGTRVQATGTMTITGVSKPVSVTVTLTPSDQGVQVEGSTRLEFATFNLEPPTVFMGMLKVGPQLRIGFKGTIGR